MSVFAWAPALRLYSTFGPSVMTFGLTKRASSIIISSTLSALQVFIAMCGCKRVSLSGRFVMGVTMSAILFVVAAFIASENFGANRQSSLVFMLQYGVSS